jgi:hypothetical protein
MSTNNSNNEMKLTSSKYSQTGCERANSTDSVSRNYEQTTPTRLQSLGWSQDVDMFIASANLQMALGRMACGLLWQDIPNIMHPFDVNAPIMFVGSRSVQVVAVPKVSEVVFVDEFDSLVADVLVFGVNREEESEFIGWIETEDFKAKAEVREAAYLSVSDLKPTEALLALSNELYKPPLKLVLGPSEFVHLQEFELLALVKCWAEDVFGSDCDWFLFGQASSDTYGYPLLDLMARVLGREKVEKVVDDVYATWKADNPTLWKIWQTGTDAEWDLVQDIANDALISGNGEIDIEAAVKAALEKQQAS